MSASPVVVPFYRAACAERAAGWELVDALDSTAPAVAAPRVRGWMAGVDPCELDAGEQIDLITELERIKSAAAALQARLSVAFAADQVDEALAAHRVQADAEGPDPGLSEAASRRRAREEAGVAAKCVRSVGSQIAAARRESPRRGDMFIGMAKALVTEMPHTMNALERGDVSEWGATMMVRGTAVLTLDDRAEVDALLGPQLAVMSPRQIDNATRREAAARQAAAVARRHEQAVKSRRVSVRPAADGMAWLTVLTTTQQAVAAYATLHRHAASVTAGTAFRATDDGTQEQEAPEGRGRGAIMADTAIARLTGRPTATPVPVEVHLVITDRALLGTGDPSRSVNDPARIPGHGTIPAPVARAWLREGTGESMAGASKDAVEGNDVSRGSVAAGDAVTRSNAAGRGDDTGRGDETASGNAVASSDTGNNAAVWLRRLYTDPTGRNLVAMDSRRRTFTGQLRRMLILRDDTCRTPYCDAPIEHGDHVTAHRNGGDTHYANAAGLCVRCNQTKESPSWRHTITSRGITSRGITSRGSAGPPSTGRDGSPSSGRDGPLSVGSAVPPSIGRAEPPDDLPGGKSSAHIISITTPTGHVHHSTAPPLLGAGWVPRNTA